MLLLDKALRRQLVVLARRSNARSSDFSTSRPTNWRPTQVRNPHGIIDDYFTNTTAWEFIATTLETGHLVEVVELQKPPGRKGFVMKVDIQSGLPQVYIKVELGSGKIFGRSFHYSEFKN